MVEVQSPVTSCCRAGVMTSYPEGSYDNMKCGKCGGVVSKEEFDGLERVTVELSLSSLGIQDG